MSKQKREKKPSYAEFAKFVCKFLGIPVPRIMRVDRISISDTCLAAYDWKNDVLFYKNIDSVETYFYIAHELRHKWQFEYHLDWFNNYKSSNELDTMAYNMQTVELDANGFAVIAYADLLGLKPTFDGVDKNITKAIYEKANEIAKGMG